MSTPPQPDPRLADSLSDADGDEPDLDRENNAYARPRIPPDEAERRLPDPDE